MLISMAGLVVMCLVGVAQDLDPRAYVRFPINASTGVTGFTFSTGGVVTDATLPIQNIEADVQAMTLGYAHAFSFQGLTSQVLAVVPYSWAKVSANVVGQPTEVTRSGFADARFRWSVLFHGARAASLEELRKAPRTTGLGFSINMVLPTGQFFPDKLVNLGSHRWSFRPELAVSHPLGGKWLLDVYAGVWLFTDNPTFYPGNATRRQEPMGTVQAHISYNVRPLFWLAFNATYYRGGQSSVDDLYNDDRNANSRIGVTAVVPTGKTSSLKFAVSTGAVVRVGQDFTSFSLGWQKTWIRDQKG